MKKYSQVTEHYFNRFPVTVKKYDPDKIFKVRSDASDRQYFRMFLKDGSTLIIQYNNPDRLEIMKTQIKSHDFLRKYGIRVCPVIDWVKSENVIVFEDAGDLSLLKFLKNKGNILDHYSQIEDILNGLTAIPAKKYKSPYEPMNTDKYLWGFIDMFEEYFIKKDLHIRLKPGMKKDMYEEFIEISEYLDDIPKVLIHRDVHSKNIFIKDGRLILLDYQDLRTGSFFYDRVSLLWDVYFDHGEKRKKLFPVLDRDIYYMYVIAIQRLFKILGNFSYLKLEKNKKDYSDLYTYRILKYLDELINLCGFKAIRSILDIIMEKTDYQRNGS